MHFQLWSKLPEFQFSAANANIPYLHELFLLRADRATFAVIRTCKLPISPRCSTPDLPNMPDRPGQIICNQRRLNLFNQHFPLVPSSATVLWHSKEAPQRYLCHGWSNLGGYDA